MTGSDLYFLIKGLSDISHQMEGIKTRDGFLFTERYTISGYMVEDIRKCTEQACKIIDSVDFVPNCYTSKKE